MAIRSLSSRVIPADLGSQEPRSGGLSLKAGLLADAVDNDQEVEDLVAHATEGSSETARFTKYQRYGSGQRGGSLHRYGLGAGAGDTAAIAPQYRTCWTYRIVKKGES
jgi:hypothetical protein